MRFLQSVTSEAMYARLRELAAERPDIDLVLKLLGAPRHAEWLHSIGPSYDEGLRRLLPPVAPLNLRAITAQRDEESFRWTGARDISRIFDIYEAYAVERPAIPRVLDFGCGGGRLSRYVGLSEHHRAFGADANPDHVEWCLSHLASVTTRHNLRHQPMPFDDGSIDLIYAWSVFTHLDREEARALFADMARVLSPGGGMLIATIHGYPALETLLTSIPHQTMMSLSAADAERLTADLKRSGYIFLPYASATISAANVGENYGNSFIDVTQASDLWSRSLTMIAHLPSGAVPTWHDAIILAKPS